MTVTSTSDHNHDQCTFAAKPIKTAAMTSLSVIMPSTHVTTSTPSSTTQVKPIAPKRKSSTVDINESASTLGRGSSKRRMTFHPSLGYAIPPPIPPKVARRNARERNRVKQVNCGFDLLRSHIPSAAKQKKMSKVDTLRHAVDYIRNLKRMLKEQDGGIKTEDEEIDCDDFDFDDSSSQHSFNESTVSTPPTPFATSTTTTSAQYHHISENNHHQTYQMPSRSPTCAQEFNLGMHAALVNSANESGYETGNFYTHPSGLMSPDSGRFSNVANHQMQNTTMLIAPVYPPQEQMSPVNSVESSPSMFSDSSSFFSGVPQLTPVNSANPSFYYTDCMEQNSEEDELLDAIVKWQED